MDKFEWRLAVPGDWLEVARRANLVLVKIFFFLFKPTQRADASSPVPFGYTLNESILVPFPVESCLSGVDPEYAHVQQKYFFYRRSFDLQGWNPQSTRQVLHFGAVDWQAEVYVNGHLLVNHTGGYDGFFIDISNNVTPSVNELIVRVFDPSDAGPQPFGKQVISASPCSVPEESVSDTCSS